VERPHDASDHVAKCRACFARRVAGADISRRADLTPAADFARFRFRHIPIVDGAKLVGIVSQRDILRVTLAGTPRSAVDRTRETRFLGETFVHELMQKDPVTARSEERLSVAARRMFEGNIGALPVVDESRNLVGIITVQDVLREVAEIL